jgi:uncharacterized membrane protein YeaQ/YmgE (transglycosylase-associated protein family)
MTGVGLFGLIIIGLVAGYVANRVTESDHGLLTNLIVGLIGSFVGGIVASVIGIPAAVGFLANLVVATLGAILFLFVWRKLSGDQGGLERANDDDHRYPGGATKPALPSSRETQSA